MSNEFVIYKIDNFSGGLNNIKESTISTGGRSSSEPIEVLNCWFRTGVDIVSRPGYDQKKAFTDGNYATTKIVHMEQYKRDNHPYLFLRFYTQGSSHSIYDYEYDFTDDSMTLLASDVGGATNPYAVGITQYANVLYWACAINGNKKYNGTAVTNMGITAPSTNCSAATGGAGNLTGTYVYYYSFYNSSTGTESALSAVSGSVSPSSEEVDLTSIDVSTDSQVDQRKIYRQGSGSDVIYYAGVIDNNTGTTFTDDTATLTVEQDCEYNTVLGTASILCSHHNQMFAAGNTSNDNYLYYSRFFYPEAFPSTYYEVFPEDIIELRAFGIDLLILTTDAIYRLRYIGVSETDYIIEEIARVGCVNKRTVSVGIGGNGQEVLFFFGRTVSLYGVFVYDGNTVSYISQAIEGAIINGAVITANYYTLYNYMNGCYYDKQYFLFTQTSAGVDTPEYCYVADFAAAGATLTKPVWTYYTIPGAGTYYSSHIHYIAPANFNPSATYPTWTVNGIYLAETDPSHWADEDSTILHYLYQQVDVDDDHGSAISMTYRTGYFGGNTYGTLRSITFNADTNGDTLTVTVYADHSTAATLTCSTSSMDRVELNVPNTCYGRQFSIKFEISSTNKVTIRPPLELKVAPWRRY